jgi:hypothetical protein
VAFQLQQQGNVPKGALGMASADHGFQEGDAGRRCQGLNHDRQGEHSDTNQERFHRAFPLLPSRTLISFRTPGGYSAMGCSLAQQRFPGV